MNSASPTQPGSSPPLPPLTSATGREELLTLTDGDPYLRWSLSEEQCAAALISPAAVVIERTKHDRRSLVLVPRPGADLSSFAATLDAVRPVVRERGVNGISVPQQYGDLLAAHYRILPGGDWDWMWTRQCPDADIGMPDAEPAPESTTSQTARLVTLDDVADAAEIASFSHAHNPRVWTEIGTGAVQFWLGVRGSDGALLAVGGAESETSGIPHLAGIVTSTTMRGRGLGRLISAGLTRWAVERYGVCTLGMFSDNAAARVIYQRLGYRTAHAWCSRRLPQD